MMVATAGQINDPRISALMRAWRRRDGRLTPYAERWIQRAHERMERHETTIEMELRRINRQWF